MVHSKTTLTRKGQITIPVGIRRSFGLREGDRLAVEQQQDQILLRRSTNVAERTSGMLAQYRLPHPLSAEEERAAFDIGVAEEEVTSSRRE